MNIWRTDKMKYDHSKLLIKILENFYDKHNIPSWQRCDAESFYFSGNDKANEWLQRYCEVWETAMSKVQY